MGPGARGASESPALSAIPEVAPWNRFQGGVGATEFARFFLPAWMVEIAASNRRTYESIASPSSCGLFAKVRPQGSLWSTQEGDMFEQTDSTLVMTLLALGGIALMADENSDRLVCRW